MTINTKYANSTITIVDESEFFADDRHDEVGVGFRQVIGFQAALREAEPGPVPGAEREE